LRARVVQTLPELLTLRDDWNRLLSMSADPTPWQGIEFIGNWWRHVGAGGGHRLRVVVVDKDGEPCLMMPLQISSWPWLGFIPIRILEPIGSLMDVNRPRLALGAFDEAAYECAFAAIWEMRRQWQTIRIDEKLQDDPEVALLRRFSERHSLRFRQAFSHLCPYLELGCDWKSYLADRSSKLRKNLRAGERRLEGMGPVSLHVHESPTEVAAAYGIVLGLHQQSWKQRKKVEHSKSDAYRSFYAGWLLAMARQSRARILVLRCAGAPVAATVAFTDEHTYYSAQIVHDTRFAACSPGTLLEARELEMLMGERRFSRYDFLGSFLNNKLRWTDAALSTTHAYAMQHSLLTWLLDAYYFWLKPRIRPLLLPLLKRVRDHRGIA